MIPQATFNIVCTDFFRMRNNFLHWYSEIYIHVLERLETRRTSIELSVLILLKNIYVSVGNTTVIITS